MTGGKTRRISLVACVSYYLGYGLTHPIALEGALKLKEITYAHCEGMFSSEFKHRPLSAVHDGYPVVFYTAPGDESMMINHVNGITVRGGWTISVAVERELSFGRFLWPSPVRVGNRA